MKNKPGIGVIGCGLMGGIHAECIARNRQAKLVGFHNRTRGKAGVLAERFGGEVFSSVGELVGCDAIDAVVVASSQQAHAEQVIAACRAGKHVLCEKPLALTPEEMEGVARAVGKSSVMVAHQLRFHPVVAAVRKAMPKLGRNFFLELEMAFQIRGSKGRCWEDYRSGGFFMELGCHLADLSAFLMGKVRHVAAGTLRLDPERVTEDFAHALLHFEGHALGSITVSANHRTTRQGLLRGRVLSEKGQIEFVIYPYSRAMNSARLVLDHGKKLFVPDTQVRQLNIGKPPSLTKPYPGFFDCYQKQMDAFLDAIRSSQPVPVSLEDGRSAVEVVLAAYASQAASSENPNFLHGLQEYRADPACHPALQQRS